MRQCLALLALPFLIATASAQPKPPLPETPVSADKRLVVELFAAAPDIVQPIALDFDAKGRLLVVESHTHFRPANYAGPKFDRIRMLEDTDGDGKADKITTFYEGTTHTMDLAVHPDGSVYVATRNEIVRLRDTKGTGTADEKTRVVFLDTKGNYPHNGLSGLSFDARGDLTFGIGENLGEPYKLTGSDGTTLTGGGEGGNVFHCTADGKKLRRVATGFWNPFGSCRDIFGRLFVVDNDPDASPPCRLLHVVEGGDYGFQFRYGRAGRHPFQAWNGELPGTLPMVAGTGESPCEVVSYESDGLPDEYRGELLVPAWADHRVERYFPYPNTSTAGVPSSKPGSRRPGDKRANIGTPGGAPPRNSDPELSWRWLLTLTHTPGNADAVDLSKLPPAQAEWMRARAEGTRPLPDGGLMTKAQILERATVNSAIRNSRDGFGGAGLTATREPFIQGGKEFYPSGLAVAPDGSLFVSDWGSKSYPLHGKGAIWHVRWKDAKPATKPKEPKEALLSPDRKTREVAARALAQTEDGRKYLHQQLTPKFGMESPDVRVRAAALRALDAFASPSEEELRRIARNDRWIGMREAAVRAMVTRKYKVAEFLAPENPPAVRTVALAGVAEEDLLADDLLLKFLASQDPFARHAGVMRLAKADSILTKLDPATLKDAQARVGLLLAWRASGLKDAAEHIPEFLKDADPDVRFLAIKWVSDEALKEFRPQIAEMLKNDKLDPREFVALSTALARIDGKPVNENSLADYFLQRLNDEKAPPATRLMALRAIPAAHKSLKTERLVGLLTQPDEPFKIEALRALKDRADAKAAPAVRAVATDVEQPAAVRAQAVLTLAALTADADMFVALAADAQPAVRQEALRALTSAKLTPEQQEKLTKAVAGKDGSADLLNRVLGKPVNAGRPDAKDADAWLKRLDGPADPQAGRRVFESTKLAGCYKCHRVEGRGADIGPDLSLIGRTERKWIVESILQPSAVVAPHYQAWKVETLDGRTRTGLLVGTQLDKSVYVDEKGNRFEVVAGEVADIRAAKESIMPTGLLDGLTDQEIRDLVAYLASRK